MAKEKKEEIKEEVPETQEKPQEEEVPVESEDEVEEIVEDINEESIEEKLKKEIEKLKNDYARAYADTENLKKRLNAEAESVRKYRIQSFAREVLPVIDNLERALVAAQDPEDNFVKGVQMTHDQLLAMLEKSGIKQIDPLGETFDPHFHEAMQHVDDEAYGESEVAAVFQKGYLMGDSLIRAALVKVAN